jgi:transposase
MQIKAILNRVQKFKSFISGNVPCIETASGPVPEVDIHPRSNGQSLCSICGRRRPGYDKLLARRFEFIPMWGYKVFFVYAPRRVECLDCGIRVEKMPWVQGSAN